MFRLLNNIIPLSFSIILTIFYFTKIGVKLGMITFISIALVIIVLYFKMPNCQHKSGETYKYIKKVNNYLNDKLNNMFHIYTSANITTEIENNRMNENELREKDVDANLCTSNLKVYLLIITILCYIFSFIQCYIDYQDGKYELGTFISNIYILNYYLDFLENISLEIPGLSYQIGVIKDEMSYLKDISNNNVDESNSTTNIKEGHIQFKDITFSYKNSKKLYDKFSMEIKPQIKTAIIGKSGSGKSTLMKLMMGFYTVDEGKILIDNIDISDYNLSNLRKNIAYVNQDTNLFNNSILFNIQYGNNTLENDIKSMIDNFGIWDFFKHMDYNLNKSVGVNGSNLSGGQKQIILILRALLNKNSRVIIMDEPTSALDSTNKKIFLDILKNIKNKTIIIVTHDNSLIEFVDKVIYLQK